MLHSLSQAANCNHGKQDLTGIKTQVKFQTHYTLCSRKMSQVWHVLTFTYMNEKEGNQKVPNFTTSPN